MAVMKACQASGVRRCVMTSSGLAVCYTAEAPANNTYNESHWSDPESQSMSNYVKSKTLAERAAWDFQSALPAE